MTLEVSEMLAADGVTAWTLGYNLVVGAYRVPADRLAREREDVEQLHCFGVSDLPCEVEVESDSTAHVGPDIVRFHNPGDRILSRSRLEAGCADNWVVLSPELLESILLTCGPCEADPARRSGRPFTRSFVKPSLPDLAALRSLLRRAEQGADQFWVEEALIVLLPALMRSNGHRGEAAGATTARHCALVQDADALLVENFAGPLSLTAVAGMLEVSAPHLARSYKAVNGHSMHSRLTSLRLGEAMRRLAEGATDITALALDLGFASHSHFTDAFRRGIGAPPSKFRNFCRDDQESESAAAR